MIYYRNFIRRGVVPLLLIFFGHFTKAQQNMLKGRVADAENKQPIPYAGIVFLTDLQKGLYTTEKGLFELPYGNPSDSIVVFALGYNTLEIAIHQASKEDTIYLSKIEQQLDTISVQPQKLKYKQKDIGYHMYGKTLYQKTFAPWRGNTFAIKIKSNKNAGNLIETVNFRIKKEGKCHNKIRVRLTKCNEENEPGEDLIFDNLIVNPYEINNPNVEINIAKYHLRLPEEGIFVLLEWLMPSGCEREDKYYRGSKKEVSPYIVLQTKAKLLVYERMMKVRWHLRDDTFGTWNRYPAVGLTVLEPK